jgi:calcium binding protein 39
VQLLGELLLVKENKTVMEKYVNDVENLKTMMNFLRDSSKSIQFEAFHVFKVFVVNPNRQPAVVEVLLANRDKLVRYLQAFHEDRGAWRALHWG